MLVHNFITKIAHNFMQMSFGAARIVSTTIKINFRKQLTEMDEAVKSWNYNNLHLIYLHNSPKFSSPR